MSSYRLAVIDLDGTLLNSAKQISTLSRSALADWLASGRKVVIASARPFYRIEPFLRELGIDSKENFAIAFNGGLTLSGDGQTCLHSTCFTEEESQTILDYANRSGLQYFLYTESSVISNRDEKVYRQRNPDVAFQIDEAPRIGALKIFKIALVGDPDFITILRRRLPKQLTERFEISSSVRQFVDFVPSGVSKSAALSAVSSIANISADETVGFGDEDNDIPLLMYAKLGVAMGNASQSVKDAANIVCDTNDDDGVARTLMRLMGADSDG